MTCIFLLHNYFSFLQLESSVITARSALEVQAYKLQLSPNLSRHWAHVSTVECNHRHVNSYKSLSVQPTSLIQRLLLIITDKLEPKYAISTWRERLWQHLNKAEGAFGQLFDKPNFDTLSWKIPNFDTLTWKETINIGQNSCIKQKSMLWCVKCSEWSHHVLTLPYQV